MITRPEEIRARVAELLAGLPDITGPSAQVPDIDVMAARLEEAHDVLVRALESVEPGTPGGGAATRGRTR